MSFWNKIIFGPDTASFNGLVDGKEVYAIIDSNVERLYGHLFPYRKIVIEANEETKSFKGAESVINRLLEQKASRNCFLLGIGGGVTTDLTGFVASIYKRGVEYGLIPTTLLAQIDAAIGGKTAVNVSDIKNAAGTFGNPEFVYINPEFIRTLDGRELNCGIFEMLKIFIIGDSENYARLIRLLKEGQFVDDFSIKTAIRIKSDIVDLDYNEQGYRKVLNLGHTFAHAIESASGWEISHGEAVATGIILAAKLGVKYGITPAELPKTLLEDFLSAGLVLPEIENTKALVSALLNDKKREGDLAVFVVPAAVGDVQLLSIRTSDINDSFFDVKDLL
ncbi:MAG: 3-dehydroquinate synthase [Bacteroidales bacterium]|nr:3-dehydroquinate synthase [Bacteroidales bacterium]